MLMPSYLFILLGWSVVIFISISIVFSPAMKALSGRYEKAAKQRQENNLSNTNIHHEAFVLLTKEQCKS